MTPTIDPAAEMADVYVRLDFMWGKESISPETSTTGRYNRVAGAVKHGSLEDLVYNVSIEHDSEEVHAGLITSQEAVVEAEVTAYEDEIRRAFMEHRNAADPGEATTAHISAVYLGQPATDGDNKPTRGSARPARATHPALHYAVRTPGAEQLNGETLEKTVRNHPELETHQIDVRETVSGFNLYIREPTITREKARVIRGIIIDTEEIVRQKTRVLYTAPDSGELPEPITGADHEIPAQSETTHNN